MGTSKTEKELTRQAQLKQIYRALFKHYGPQHWWPAKTPFEVAVGAILTQNTAWTNAAQAIAQLKKQKLLSPKKIHEAALPQLAQAIRSSGYYNQKALKLKTFAGYLIKRCGGRLERLKKLPWPQVRQELLALSGIGPETADSILLYALEQPVFVVDAYTKRVLSRHSLIPPEASYEQIQRLFVADQAAGQAGYFNEYHALIVAIGKNLCKTNGPSCHICPLRKIGALRVA